METEETTEKKSEDYKDYEIELHREIMNSCRKYKNKLGIYTILGILDYVKQETIELENVTSHNLNNDPSIDLE
jgi:hypothetical protein